MCRQFPLIVLVVSLLGCSAERKPLIQCAQKSPTPACVAQCEPSEVCFTQVTCGPLADGGSVCSLAPSTIGDDRCHRTCEKNSDCADGEECRRYQFFDCTDYNGWPDGRAICVSTGI